MAENDMSLELDQQHPSVKPWIDALDCPLTDQDTILLKELPFPAARAIWNIRRRIETLFRWHAAEMCRDGYYPYGPERFMDVGAACRVLREYNCINGSQSNKMAYAMAIYAIAIMAWRSISLRMPKRPPEFHLAKLKFLAQNLIIVSRWIVWPHFERRYHLSIYFEGSARSC